ncbi:MAG TPA: hypothetical protein VHZ74_10755 [Bryobacteraceae bacterium]|jgi:hypothetical protein|nr:hypothetical protein [Bryobacteraceae bacterium]
MSTFGDINFLLAKEFPGVDADVRQGIINDRYTQILDRLPWSRLDTETVIQTVAQYNTGTIQTTNASTALVLTDGAFTTQMSGRQIHLDGRTEAYTLTFVDATHATLDRPYEGDPNATAGFVISQSILTLPTSCRIVRSLRNISLPIPIEKRDRASADVTDPARIAVGPPTRWSQWADGSGSPIPMQLELWPAPDNVYSILISFTAEQTAFGTADTGVALLPWIRPGALKAGCRADLSMLPGVNNLAAAQLHEGLFEKRVGELVNEESRRQGGAQMAMQGTYTRHRADRWARQFRAINKVL